MRAIYGGLRNRRRYPGLPPLTARVARAFSTSLLRIHAAGSLRELEATLRHERARHAADPGLVRLLDGHRLVRREQLQARTPRPGGARLTPREDEVLRRIGLGETDAQIGATLGIATRTVSKHVENILAKLGVETRTAAVRQARGPS